MDANKAQRPPLNTFIIRLWREPGLQGSRWRGHIRHVQSGESLAFADERSLLNFIRRWIWMEGPPGDDRAP